MTNQELLAKTRRVMNAQNQADSDEEFERLDIELQQCIAEMDKRGLDLDEIPAWNEV